MPTTPARARTNTRLAAHVRVMPRRSRASTAGFSAAASNTAIRIQVRTCQARYPSRSTKPTSTVIPSTTSTVRGRTATTDLGRAHSLPPAAPGRALASRRPYGAVRAGLADFLGGGGSVLVSGGEHARPLDDPEPLGKREERPRERRRARSLLDPGPVDLLAESPRDLEHGPEVRLLLAQREELRHHDVVDRRDEQALRGDLDERGSREVLVVDAPPAGRKMTSTSTGPSYAWYSPLREASPFASPPRQAPRARARRRPRGRGSRRRCPSWARRAPRSRARRRA